jgi:hypothetical protein
MDDSYQPEERAFDALVVSLFRQQRDLRNLSELPPLSDEEIAALDALPADDLARIWAEESRSKPAVLTGLNSGSPLGIPSVAWSIGLVALVTYSTFVAISWNLRGDRSLWAWQRPREASPERPHVEDHLPALGKYLATVTAEKNSVWALPEESSAIRPGVRLRANQELHLESGSVELAFDGGVRLTIEGPSQFELQADDRLALAAGKLLAQVSQQAIGFMVKTPHAEVVDLGTEFTVEVADDGLAQVAVLVGKVSVQPSPELLATPAAARPLIVTAGKSVQVAALGGVASIPYRPAVFSRETRSMASPNHARSIKDGYRVVAQYQFGKGAGQMSPAAEGRQVPAHPDAYFQTPLAVAGKVLLDLGAGAHAMRLMGGEKLAVLTAQGLPSLGDHFVLEANLLPEVICDSPVVYYGDMAHNGVGIAVRLEQWSVMLGGVGVFHSGVRCQPGKWTHVAVVLEQGRVSMLVDGQLAEGPWQIRGRTSNGCLSVGGYPGIARQFVGLVSDVRLLDLHHKFDPRMLLTHAVNNSELKHRGTVNAEEFSQ